MSGIHLAELELSQMLDVIHFLMEEDLLSAGTKEEVEAKDHARTSIYRILYNKEYAYASQKSSATAGFSDLPPDVDNIPKVTKPYTPATDFDPDSALPFGQDIDAPLM